MNPKNVQVRKTWNTCTQALISIITYHLFSLWLLQQVKPYTVYMKDRACWCRWAPPTQLPHSPPPSWQIIPISTWMVFNYVPRGYHGSSISSVWQCNSLCPAAMSAKLRQFTCSCSYIALGKSDLPSILCIHLISGTHSLTPPTWAVTGVTKSKREVCLICLSMQRMATKSQRSRTDCWVFCFVTF